MVFWLKPDMSARVVQKERLVGSVLELLSRLESDLGSPIVLLAPAYIWHKHSKQYLSTSITPEVRRWIYLP